MPFRKNSEQHKTVGMNMSAQSILEAKKGIWTLIMRKTGKQKENENR